MEPKVTLSGVGNINYHVDKNPAINAAFEVDIKAQSKKGFYTDTELNFGTKIKAEQEVGYHIPLYDSFPITYSCNNWELGLDTYIKGIAQLDLIEKNPGKSLQAQEEYAKYYGANTEMKTYRFEGVLGAELNFKTPESRNIKTWGTYGEIGAGLEAGVRYEGMLAENSQENSETLLNKPNFYINPYVEATCHFGRSNFYAGGKLSLQESNIKLGYSF